MKQMNLEKFVRWCIIEGPFSGCDLDGGDVQDMAVKCGIVRQVPYDPAIHGENDYDAEPGDPWFIFTEEFKAMCEASDE